MTYPTLFNEKRTAQAAAFLLHKAGGRLPLLKLMKLMYLAERESLRVFGEPITGDRLVSLPQGPVLSKTLDMMNGWGGEAQGGWNSWVEDRSGHDLALRDPSMIRSPEQDLLELSNGDLEVLESVWAEFGHMGKFDLVQYTHSEACPEWEDPNGSSRPIPTGRLLRALGYDGDALRSVLDHLNEQAKLNAVLSQY
ncbi:hypothetical protein CHR62_09115 [Pusillimonas sp. NJUB218]|nr:hypothetical protein CHR62_09115 [Pusillimonas sp. NJUB218]